eukprot:COSAG05_NODE_1316_length_5210_cov_51.150851_5_plen_82_part_00
MISQDAGSILASMVLHRSGEHHTNTKTIMAEPELNDLRSPSVHIYVQLQLTLLLLIAVRPTTSKPKQTRCNTRKLVKRPSP